MKVKVLTAIVLIASILFTGCAQSVGGSVNTSTDDTTTASSTSEAQTLGTESVTAENASEITSSISESTNLGDESDLPDNVSETTLAASLTPETDKFISTIDPTEFTGPDDKNFLQYVKDATYAEAVKNLNNDEYVVENVEVTYISPEYIAELEYNSKVNIYFGHTEEDLAKQFDGEQVVFTMDEKGQTSVEKFVPNGKGLDPTYKKALIKTGIGVGVILVCVVVSVATKGAAPAVAAVFAFSAKSAAIGGAISGTTSGVLAGAVEGFRNKNFDRAAKAAAESGADSFMWSSIICAITGGVSELSFLSKVSKATNLSLNEVAIIQKESALPLEVIKKLNSMKEYEVLKNANLKTTEMNINGETHSFLTRKIDWSYIDPSTITTENPKGLTNLQLALRGNAPFDPSGKRYQLHHVGQHADTVFAVLREEEHKLIPTPDVGVDRSGFDALRKAFWKKIGELVSSGVLF